MNLPLTHRQNLAEAEVCSCTQKKRVRNGEIEPEPEGGRGDLSGLPPLTLSLTVRETHSREKLWLWLETCARKTQVLLSAYRQTQLPPA
jgi:hypothetical protein